MVRTRLDLRYRRKAFFRCKGEFKHPEQKLEIYRTNNQIKNELWELFKKYHYLTGTLQPACEQYIGVLNGEIVCHTGVIQMPMQKGKKRVHRLVVLPDYQGVGIGTKFIKEIAKIYTEKGFEFNLTTTTPSLVNALKKDPEWILGRFGRVSGSGFKYMSKKYHLESKHLDEATSEKRITYSFWFKPRREQISK